MKNDKFNHKLKTIKKPTLKKMSIQISKSKPPYNLSTDKLRSKTIDLKRNACCFNCSIIKHNGIYLAYRKGDERINYVEIIKLNNNLNPIYETKQKLSNYSSEDPRLWTYKDDLYCSWTSVKYKGNTRNGSNIEVYRIKDQKLFTIDFRGHQKQWLEKNWTFFQCEEDLYCCYQFDPYHIIFKLEVDEEKSQLIFKDKLISKGISWRTDMIFGGTPPVLYKDRYWSFFHGRVGGRWGRTYSMGLYSFNPNPPFQPLSMSKEPILIGAPWGGNTWRQHKVVFPCGSYVEDDTWTVSLGYNDQESRVIKRTHDSLVKTMHDL